VLVSKPEQDVKVSYGTIAMLVIGAGSCQRLVRADELSDRLLEKATQYLRHQVDNR
jgi:hypothetical protein